MKSTERLRQVRIILEAALKHHGGILLLNGDVTACETWRHHLQHFRKYLENRAELMEITISPTNYKGKLALELGPRRDQGWVLMTLSGDDIVMQIPEPVTVN